MVNNVNISMAETNRLFRVNTIFLLDNTADFNHDNKFPHRIARFDQTRFCNSKSDFAAALSGLLPVCLCTNISLIDEDVNDITGVRRHTTLS